MTFFHPRNLRTVLLAAAVFALAGCGESAPFQPAASEPEVGFSFTTSHRPSVDYGRTLAVLLGAGGLALQGDADDEPAAPIYADIEFFPVLDADALAGLTRGFGRRSGEHQGDIDAIDFDTHFAFVVAHPAMTQFPGGAHDGGNPGIYRSQPKVRYADDGIDITLDASRLGGDIDPMGLAFAARWESKVYVIERRDADTLRVRLYDDDYRFSLAPEAAAAADEDEAGDAEPGTADAADDASQA
ncbi:hypothetical protein LDO26_06025 [Luteimonas sp. BDR2-5]|uniref:hypothetical protein n=1 Tax=Proluteimonas luteida TaxID=2878685 RepID=UPI001E446CC2|nr:hypothetical protein [Luteimonas sp. BDR2-5]MCD9027759.1 hypothetical protein [Luteimonas sp. BDR2-5]